MSSGDAVHWLRAEVRAAVSKVKFFGPMGDFKAWGELIDRTLEIAWKEARNRHISHGDGTGWVDEEQAVLAADSYREAVLPLCEKFQAVLDERFRLAVSPIFMTAPEDPE